MSQASLEDLYLDLLTRVLTRRGFEESWLRDPRPDGAISRRLWPTLQQRLDRSRFVLKEAVPFIPDRGALAATIPGGAETMIGQARMANLRWCVSSVLDDDVPGDLIETGVWRGGACILMRAILAARGVTDRTVWIADSFRGVPPPSGRYPADEGDTHYRKNGLAVSREEVEDNFRRFGLLDDQVKFLEGLFSETLPAAPIGQLALLRLDGDMYESTMDALQALYPKLSPGGYLIVDDYGAVPGCRAATDDYRSRNGIKTEIEAIDGMGVYWRKPGGSPGDLRG